MGRRATTQAQVSRQQNLPKSCRTIQKRKRNSGGVSKDHGSASKAMRFNNNEVSPYQHHRDNNDEENAETSSNGGNEQSMHTPVRNQCTSSKHANNSSILLNVSNVLNSTDQSINDSPRPVYTLRPSVVNGTILHDLTKKPWRLGSAIGKGNFGEIFLASDNITIPAVSESSKYVVKIEPHSNGPLFVEIHCLMNTARKSNTNNFIKCENPTKGTADYDTDKLSALPVIPEEPPCGIPDYIASGSHCFGNARYRFLLLPRFDHDLHSLIKNTCISQKCLLTLAINILTVLENLHDRGYCHNDVKAQNLMISKCKYYCTRKKITQTDQQTIRKNKSTNIGNNNRSSARDTLATFKIKEFCDMNYEEKQQTTDSGNSSEQEANEDFKTYTDSDDDFVVRRKSNYGLNGNQNDDEDDEDFDDCTTTNSNNSVSLDSYGTPLGKSRKRGQRPQIEFSGSNPVRSCRRPQRRNSIYEEMVNSHYLRPVKRISYSEFFEDDNVFSKDTRNVSPPNNSDNESQDFIPRSMKHRALNNNDQKNSMRKKQQAKPLTRRQEKILANKNANTTIVETTTKSSANCCDEKILHEAEHIFLIDYGLASKYMERGVHRPFIMDQRRAHDGTLEFTSRDAHMGAHSRRSDLECLGYNLLFWSQGYLPWKEAANLQQQEKVHRIKEYLMANVREMLKLVYGKDVPKYLGEFLHLISQLAYNERPNYAHYRRLFQREYVQLGYSISDMHLSSNELKNTGVRIKKDSIDQSKCDIFSMYNNNGLNLSVGGTPFQDRSLSDRVSPKNLRSKTDKKAAKKKKFSWAEILSQDPDQIARERAEKEFDREDESNDTELPARKYEGKPTYAILAIKQRLGQSQYYQKNNDEVCEDSSDNEDGEENEEGENDDGESEDNEYVQDSEDEGDEAEEEYEEENASEVSQEVDDEDESEETEGDYNEIGSDAAEASHENKSVEEENVRRSKRSTKRSIFLNVYDLTKQKRRLTTKKALNKQNEIRTSRNLAAANNNDDGDDANSDNDADDDATNGYEEKQKAKIAKDKAKRSMRNTKANRTKSRITQTNGNNNNHVNGKRGAVTTNNNHASKEVSAIQAANTRSLGRKFGSTRQQQQQQINFHHQAASAAGEIEQSDMGNPKLHRLFENSNQQGIETNENKAPKRARERRSRRCIHKTDVELMEVDESSNSNFSQDVRTIYNVWKRLSNENMYYTTASAITSGRHGTRK